MRPRVARFLAGITADDIHVRNQHTYLRNTMHKLADEIPLAYEPIAPSL